MKNKIFFPILFITFFCFSCEKILDIDQKMNIPNDKAITSVNDLKSVLIGAYDGLQSGNVLGGNMVVYADLLSDDTNVDESRLTNFGTREIYDRATTVQLTPLRSMWAEAYASINRANTVIYYIDNNLLSGDDFEQLKGQLKGEALFIRAIAHFEIMRFWSLPYNVDNQGGNTQLAVPYRTQPTFSGFEDLAMARNTVEEVYSNVISDLIQSQTLLAAANIKKSTNKASEMAATAYLARVCFSKGDYVNASIYASNVINSGLYSLNTDLQAVFQTTGNEASTESIFQLVNISTDQSNSIVYNYSPSDASNPLFTGISVDIISDLYSVKDNRRTKYVSINTFAGIVFAKKYKSANPQYNVSVIRLAEMYLIKAESDILSNNISQNTYDCYTAVKKRAFGTNWVDETILQAALIDSVRLEHRREMIFEGDRYHNLKRMKMPERDGIPYNDPSLLFKIPQEEMSGNPLMVQNP